MRSKSGKTFFPFCHISVDVNGKNFVMTEAKWKCDVMSV